jgi:hypothetical protein
MPSRSLPATIMTVATDKRALVHRHPQWRPH